MVDLSIIIVSYNTKQFLFNCLQSVEADTLKTFSSEIIVVDNNSTDGSSEMVKKEYPHVKLIQNKNNVGFSAANNIGIKKSNGRYILFLNSDTFIYTKTLEIMFSFMEKNSYTGAATCKVMLPNNILDEACHRGFPTPWNAFCYFTGLIKLFPHSKLFAGYTRGWEILNTVHEIDSCAGAFCIVRRAAGDSIGWWDEDYFFYGEDLEFCFKLKENGWKIYYVPTASVLHYKGISGGIKKVSQDLSPASIETRQRASKARFSAMRIFYRKHYESVYPSFITKLVFGAIFIKEKLSFLH